MLLKNVIKKNLIIIFSVIFISIILVNAQNYFIELLSKNIIKPNSYNFLENNNLLVDYGVYWFNSSLLWLFNFSNEITFIQTTAGITLFFKIIINLIKNIGFVFGNNKFVYVEI